MPIQAKVVYPYGLAQLKLGSRLITLTDVRFEETYGGVIEGAPRPETDASRRRWFLASLGMCWGERATHVVAPEIVEVQDPRSPIQRMPAVACAAWLKSDPVTDAGAASELVLVWWRETLELPVAALVEQALAGVEWERVARDFDY